MISHLISNSIGWRYSLHNVVKSIRNSHILNNITLMDNVCEMSRKVLQNKHNDYTLKFKLAELKHFSAKKALLTVEVQFRYSPQ